MLSRMAERRPIRKQNEVRTVWWEPDAVCLIDQTSAHPGRRPLRIGRSGGGDPRDARQANRRHTVTRGARSILLF
jgi:hypothetical protein